MDTNKLPEKDGTSYCVPCAEACDAKHDVPAAVLWVARFNDLFSLGFAPPSGLVHVLDFGVVRGIVD
jgi:hypothetical protein